jgi:competence protein ComEA
MRSRPAFDDSDDSVADVTRRRLDALIVELAAARGELPPERAPVEAGEQAPTSGRPGGRHALRPLTASRRVAGWLSDRLPPALQGRAHLGAAQFGLVALVVAVGLVVGAWFLVQAGGSSDGAGEVAPPRPITAVPTTTAPTGPSPSSSDGAALGTTEVPGPAEGKIVVDVVGKVRDPGIAVLPAGSRVVDAVRAAGGMRPGVDPASVNLARPLTDGEQVVIGLPGTPTLPGGLPMAATPDEGTGLVSLNTADQATLETLPGVGPVTAAAIIQWRTEHGGFTSVDELLEVSGIGDATLAEIAPHVTL